MENIDRLEGDLPCILINDENWIDDRSVRCQAGNPTGQTQEFCFGMKVSKFR